MAALTARRSADPSVARGQTACAGAHRHRAPGGRPCDQVSAWTGRPGRDPRPGVGPCAPGLGRRRSPGAGGSARWRSAGCSQLEPNRLERPRPGAARARRPRGGRGARRSVDPRRRAAGSRASSSRCEHRRRRPPRPPSRATRCRCAVHPRHGAPQQPRRPTTSWRRGRDGAVGEDRGPRRGHLPFELSTWSTTKWTRATRPPNLVICVTMKPMYQLIHLPIRRLAWYPPAFSANSEHGHGDVDECRAVKQGSASRDPATPRARTPGTTGRGPAPWTAGSQPDTRSSVTSSSISAMTPAR